MGITITPINKRQRVHFYIYKNQKMLNYYIYKQKARHFAKSKTISVRFLLTEIHTLYVTRLSWNVWNCHLYIHKRHDTFALREVFIYKKPETSKKARQFALRFLINKKPDTLRFAIFMKFLKLAEGGRRGVSKQKIMHFPFRFYIQKAWHFVSHFYILKTMHFALRFFISILSYRIFWYLTINVRTIRAIRLINKLELFIENWSYSYDK